MIALKRMVACQAEVSQAQEALVKAQSKLHQEEQGLSDGEARMATLMQESAGGPRVEEVLPTIPADFANELAELRTCLSELRRENLELRSQLSSGRSGEERERKQPRSLASSTLDLEPLNRVPSDHATMGVGQSMPMLTADSSVSMETLIDNAEASLRSYRFNPPLRLTGDVTFRVPVWDGSKGVRVGEASNPGPPRLLPTASLATTQADSVDEELMTQLEADLSGENRRPEVHVLSEGSSGSDTESIKANGPTRQVRRDTRRRLRLRWSSFATEHASLHREASVADAFVRARQAGVVPWGGRLPRVLQQKRWSPLNVPLIWSAAGAEDTTTVLEWLAGCAETMDEEVDFYEGRVNPADAVRVGWTALRAALRSWGVSCQDDLTQWLRDQRFAGAQPGNHIPARAQEFLFSEACRFDARVALLEAFFVRLTLHMGRQMAVPHGAIPVNAQASVQVVEVDR